ncbi:carbohydrate esterase family 1 protein [Emericellopsis atlantica]|uniref:feruloyl esterase n=1 Tax=Emericellopsis atlantica TaxID=2614577 RepID=A0A9P8CMU4_9HYPO|nr:carbohydrate esterase family 1 protein [Emericellopsis atlantica]KAG9253079.1 carbohydrate esterase family 1 protein [Emericellopsis atlantica]
MRTLQFLALGAISSLAAAWTPSPGCQLQGLPEGQTPGSFHNATVDGRRYLVFVPPEYAIGNPAPLVLSYHGGSRSPENQRDLDLLTDPDFNTHRMVVYPEGTPRPTCESDNTCYKRYWSVDPGIDADDKSFTRDILTAMKETYCIDTDAVHATGKSQGGGIVGSTLACDADLAHTFAAFAPVSGSFYTDVDVCEPPYEFEIPCDPHRHDVPMLEFHGGQDTTVAYSGASRRGVCLPNIPYWVEQWAVNDGISHEVETTPLAADTPNTYITRYGRGRKKGLVTHVLAENIAHDWPSTRTNSDNEGAVAEFDATPLILHFFDEHPLKKHGGCHG